MLGLAELVSQLAHLHGSLHSLVDGEVGEQAREQEEGGSQIPKCIEAEREG